MKPFPGIIALIVALYYALIKNSIFLSVIRIYYNDNNTLYILIWKMSFIDLYEVLLLISTYNHT